MLSGGESCENLDESAPSQLETPSIHPRTLGTVEHTYFRAQRQIGEENTRLPGSGHFRNCTRDHNHVYIYPLPSSPDFKGKMKTKDRSCHTRNLERFPLASCLNRGLHLPPRGQSVRAAELALDHFLGDLSTNCRPP